MSFFRRRSERLEDEAAAAIRSIGDLARRIESLLPIILMSLTKQGGGNEQIAGLLSAFLTPKTPPNKPAP